MSLKAMRIKSKLTQQAVANKFGTTQGAVWQWESGECFPHSSKIPKLAELYGVTAGEIIAACEEARIHKKNSA